jgi:hypothetical protein
MDPLINLANLLYVSAYFVRDILWLRTLSATAACCLTAHFYLMPEPLMTIVYWNVFFAALNALWIGRLVRERRVALRER